MRWMWKLCAALLLAMLARSALAAAPPPSLGQHGMVLFGGAKGLYASHLPMFHAPHDVQLVLRVHLEDPALDARVRARLDGRTALWTLAPEQFELDRLAPSAARPLRHFRTDVVLGHFEQDGARQYQGAVVVVDEVLVYRRLATAPAVARKARYFQIGQGRQRFLVKRIDSRPDVDHIVAIRAPKGAPAVMVSVPKRGLMETDGALLRAVLPGAAILGTIYFDTHDLR